jgi:hypothetical protein
MVILLLFGWQCLVSVKQGIPWEGKVGRCIGEAVLRCITTLYIPLIVYSKFISLILQNSPDFSLQDILASHQFPIHNHP